MREVAELALRAAHVALLALGALVERRAINAALVALAGGAMKAATEGDMQNGMHAARQHARDDVLARVASDLAWARSGTCAPGRLSAGRKGYHTAS